MQKYLILLYALLPITAFSQTYKEINIPVVCVTNNSLAETLDEFEELPFARGISSRENSNHSLVIFVSKKERTWTIAERISKDKYCIIAVGDRFEPIPTNILNEFENRQKKGKL
jgi:hypothetical protein